MMKTTQAWCGARFQRNFNGKQSKEKLELARNIRGDSHTSKLANVPAYGEVWFDENTNILSFAEMKAKYRITFDSFNEKAFAMHYSHKKSNFVAVKNWFYICKPNQSTNNASLVNLSIESVDG